MKTWSSSLDRSGFAEFRVFNIYNRSRYHFDFFLVEKILDAFLFVFFSYVDVFKPYGSKCICRIVVFLPYDIYHFDFFMVIWCWVFVAELPLLKYICNCTIVNVFQGCARFTENLSELTKTWSSGATECGVWIGNCNVKVWKSTEHKLHNIWRSVKFLQNEHTPGGVFW